MLSFRRIEHEIAVDGFQIEIPSRHSECSTDWKFLDLIFSIVLRLSTKDSVPLSLGFFS